MFLERSFGSISFFKKIYSLLGYDIDLQISPFTCNVKKYDLPKINNLYDYQLDIYKYNLISVLTELMYFRFIEYFSFEYTDLLQYSNQLYNTNCIAIIYNDYFYKVNKNKKSKF